MILLALKCGTILFQPLTFTEFKVLHEDAAKGKDELTILKDDIIGNVQTAFDGWNKGTFLKERKWFPDNYVNLNVEFFSESAFSDMGIF